MASGIAAGASAGAAIGTAIMPGIGTAIGGIGGGLIGAIPSLIKTDAEKENEKRLKELRRQQEMGTLGLTEAEMQSLFNREQAAISGGLQQAQSQIRAAGASGMQTGAGNELLRQQQAAQQQAALLAQTTRSIEEKNLLRKRELEDEIQARIAADSEYNQARAEALTGVAVSSMGGYADYENSKSMDIQKSKDIQAMSGMFQAQKGMTAADANAFATFLAGDPKTAGLLSQFANIGAGK